MIKSAKRGLLAMAFAVVSLALVVGPALAETTLVQCNGTCGDYQVTDMGPTGGKGAVCKYETNSFDLDFISVRPPIMHGPFSTKSKVGWRYRIFRSTNFGSSYSLYAESNWQTAKASTSIAVYAGSGFARRYWYAPDPNPKGFFKVRINLRWWNLSGSRVIGNAALEYDWYQRLWNGQTNAAQNYCIQDW